MASFGTSLKDKIFQKINSYLPPLLDGDEKIIAIFNANRIKPATNALVLTNRRLITFKGITREIEPVYEIPADELLNFGAKKGLGKTIKFFIVKKNDETEFVCNMSGEDILAAIKILPQMSGSPQPIIEKLSFEKRQLEEHKKEKRQAQKSTKQEAKQEEKAAKQAAREEEKAMRAEAIKTRGRSLGYVRVKYIGGYSPEHKKSFTEGRLECYENEVIYRDKRIVIPANQIVSFEITGKEQTNSRISVTRMATLGVFSLAAPKRSTKKEASIYIGLKDGRQLMFQTKSLSESDVHQKLANAISHYSGLRIQNEVQPPQPIQALDIPGEIARFAELKEQGILTDDEFNAKKKQLLEL
jgi:hypothetical protein